MNPRGNRRAPAPRPASAAPTRVEAQPEPPTCQDVITHLTDDPKLGRCIRLRRLESSKKLKAVMVATPPTPGRVWLGGEKVTARSNYKYIEKHNSAEPTLRSGHTTRFRQLARRLPRPRPGATLRLVSTRGVVVSRCVRSRGGSMGGRRSHMQITVTHRRLHGASGRR